jgi:cytochrome c oxidase subunit IV
VKDFPMSTDSISKTLRTGWVVIALLFVLTLLEFAVAMTLYDAPLITGLSILAVAKSALIVQYFMHFGQLWNQITVIWNGITSTTSNEDEQ